MGVVLCGCGETFNDGGIPCRHQYNLVADVDLDALLDEMVEAHKLDDGLARMGVAMLAGGRLSYICPHCSAILVFWDGIDGPATYYKLSPPSPPNG